MGEKIIATKKLPGGKEKKLAFELAATCELGTYADLDSLKAAIKAAGMEISWKANEAIDAESFPISAKKEELLFVRTTTKDLGFTAPKVRYSTICKRAIGAEVSVNGHDYVVESFTNEAILYFRLAYKDQPAGTGAFGGMLQIGMNPILHQQSRWIFALNNDSKGPWILILDGGTKNPYLADSSFAFVLRRKKSA